MHCLTVNTPLGPLTIRANEHRLTYASFGCPEADAHSSPLLAEAARQIEEWFAGTRDTFELPLNLQGTEFQKAVWRQLMAIPRGQFSTYGRIAEVLGNPGASRAVGGACGANPLILIIPCHRVLAKGGKLGGFSGGLELKKQLLKLEGITWT